VVSGEAVKRNRSDTDPLHIVGDFDAKHDYPLPSAVLLRRRFSSQRQNNLSTSSSGTTGTGCLNTTCSSTDSSLDTSNFSADYVRSALSIDTPRKSSMAGVTAASSLPRFSVTCEPDMTGGISSEKKELSPVDESRSVSSHVVLRNSDRNEGSVCESERVLQLEIPKHSSPLLVQQSPGGSVSSASSADGASSNSVMNPAQITDQNFLKAPLIIKWASNAGLSSWL
ncbi:unnamed protein product, partial [Gongylonema pulchrum]|uniref:Pecanex-like protein n=1 Tax=Gongylonema pulchrum TaxID=637853 RepID=A0A183D0L1_9BILA